MPSGGVQATRKPRPNPFTEATRHALKLRASLEAFRSDPDVPIGHRMAPARPVRIGAGSWLGTGVVVLSGVTIGERVTVGANSVVCDDLPDGSVAVGAPARVVREASALPSAADDDQRRAGGDQ